MLSKTKRLQAIEFSLSERRLALGVLLLVRQTATRIFCTNSALRVSEREANVTAWMDAVGASCLGFVGEIEGPLA